MAFVIGAILFGIVGAVGGTGAGIVVGFLVAIALGTIWCVWLSFKVTDIETNPEKYGLGTPR